MRYIAKIKENDRKALFHNTAAKMGMTDAIVEKDFWVCYMLDYLFHRCTWKDHIAFKGGTSLSKAYGLIERFSEDIDLILDWRVLGYGVNEPWEERSNTKQDIFNMEANAKAEVFLRDTFLPSVIDDLTAELGNGVKCFIDPEDAQTVKIAYPNSFSDMSILQEIRLEIGALAAWTPVKVADITPYAAKEYSRLFKQPSTAVLTVLPERTFWEKVTILHRLRGDTMDNSAAYLIMILSPIFWFVMKLSAHYSLIYIWPKKKVGKTYLKKHSKGLIGAFFAFHMKGKVSAFKYYYHIILSALTLIGLLQMILYLILAICEYVLKFEFLVWIVICLDIIFSLVRLSDHFVSKLR